MKSGDTKSTDRLMRARWVGEILLCLERAIESAPTASCAAFTRELWAQITEFEETADV